MNRQQAKEIQRKRALSDAARAIHYAIIRLPFRERLKYCWTVLTKRPIKVVGSEE